MAVNPKAAALNPKIKAALQKSKAGVSKIVTELETVAAKRKQVHDAVTKFVNTKRTAKR
ncbi:MAG: hypothetical protein WDO73_21300 [Ignavibacteriota bacterium]